MYEGRNFPLDSELQYSTGVLNSRYQSGRQHLVLTHPITKEDVEFSCSYSAYNKLSLSACSNPLKNEQVFGKNAIVGWYYQKDFLNFHNPLPQLVSIKIENKEILTYSQTYQTVQNVNRGRMILSVSFTIFIIIVGFLAHIILGEKNGTK